MPISPRRLAFALLIGHLPLFACESAAEPDGGAAQVASVVVTPPTAALAVTGASQTVQLQATPRDGTGQAIPGLTIAWESSAPTVASVSSTGLVTALGAGTATVTATVGGQSAQSTVTVTAGSAATVLLSEGFEDDNWASRGWYDHGTFSTTTADKVGGSRALQLQFAQGATNPSFTGGRVSFAATPTLYVRYWVKYSSNWVGSGRTSHPHEFFFLTTENSAFVGPARTRLTVYVEHNYQNGGYPRLAWQDGENVDNAQANQNLVGVTEARAVAGCNGNADGHPSSCYAVGAQWWNFKQLTAPTPRFLATPGPGYKGDWHLVEAYFQLNTIVGGIGQTNGIARYWFDGDLVLEATNVQFRTGARPNMQFNQMLLSPYIGSGAPVAQGLWIDDLLLATARP